MIERYPPIEFEQTKMQAIFGLCVLSSVYAAAIYFIVT
jgi:hypothetical protein